MKIHVSSFACVSALLLCISAHAAPTIVWSIGSKDNSGREFGLERHKERFAQQITPGFTFHIGTDAPAKWPYIHPGPIDRWANTTTHPLDITFDLPAVPTGQCSLLVNTLGTYAGAQENVEIVINGSSTIEALPKGPGDQVLHDETKAKPASTRIEFSPELLTTGTNHISITIVDGAWALYDNVQLECDEQKAPERLSAFKLESTPCFTTIGAELKQVVRASLKNSGPSIEYSITVNGVKPPRMSGMDSATNRLKFGSTAIDIPVSQVDRPTSLVVSVLPHNAPAVSGEVLLNPQRKWKLYLQPSIHTDIGYTDRQAEVFHRHNANLDKVMEMCSANPLFKWSIEVAWEVENYFADRDESARQKLISLMQQGRIGLNGGYLNLLTALMSDEAMNHYAYYAAGLRRKYGVPFCTSLMTDIPSATRGLASVMAASGINYFAEGCNEDRGPLITHSGIHAPFYWEGPGGERVLTWLSQGYAQSAWLAHSRDVDALYENVAGVIRSHERRGDEYPFDAAYLYGAFLDNNEVDMRYGSLLKQWNARYAYPQILISRGPEFFEYIEQNFSQKIGVRKTDFGAYWEDGAGSTQQETILHMENQRRITTAETLWSLAKLNGAPEAYPLERFRKAWEDILFYCEHTWGAAQSVRSPEDQMTIDQWKVKAEYAHRPDKESQALEKEGLDAYIKTLPAAKWQLVVYNPTSWPRSGIVEMPRISFGGRPPTDAQSYWVPGKTTEYAWFQDVPPLGSKVVRLASEPPKPPNRDLSIDVMENKYYRVEFSGERGITRILDKETNYELIDKKSPYGFAQVVYASGGEGTRMIHPDQGEFATFQPNSDITKGLNAPKNNVLVTPAKAFRVQEEPGSGSLWQDTTIWSAAPSMSNIATYVRLYEKEKRLSIEVNITSKTEVHTKEAVYVAFPFTGQKPAFRLGMSNAIQRPEKDFSHGACHEWYCVQDFVSCTDTSNNTEVVWTSPDAPLVCLSEINRGRWLSDPELTTPTIFSYAMNNYWHTNYKAGQGGDFRFRYDITSGKAGFTNEHCIHFSRESAMPLIAGITQDNQGKPPTRQISATGKGVVIGTIKAAEDGNGTVVRLRNVEDSDTVAKLRVVGSFDLRAELLNIVEDSTSTTLRGSNGEYEIPMRPQQLATVRLF